MNPESPEGDRPKPISIRDAVREKAPPARGGGDGSSARTHGRVPEPVRGRVEPPPASPGDAGVDGPRCFSVGEVEWTARVTGMSRSGMSPDSGVPLIHLTFTDGEGSRSPREIIAAAEALHALDDEELSELLARSRESDRERAADHGP